MFRSCLKMQPYRWSCASIEWQSRQH